jgi:putative oxygen-independent coproporphyrinogen III oxidase
MQTNAEVKFPKSLYVHIPYCDHICHYCDFTKMLTNRQQTLVYVHEVLKEIASYGKHLYQTIFFGGGTPTALNDEELTMLCQGVAQFAAPGAEWSVECNVESTTPEKLTLMKRAGVNRLSFGVQTFKVDALRSLNRHHNQREIISTIQEAKRQGFNRINVDLIYDLPKVNDDDLTDDLNKFLTLDVDHIATYALTIHPNTVFGIQKLKSVSDDVSRRHYETIYHTLLAHGYERYEVSNFARNKDYARHNLTYWRNEEYIGCGLGASGYLHGVRYTNTKNMTKYLQGVRRDQEEIIDLKMKRFEFLMLNLRLNDGFSLTNFRDECHQDFELTYEKNIPALIEKKLLTISDNRVRLTFEGMILLDYVLLKLTKDTI